LSSDAPCDKDVRNHYFLLFFIFVPSDRSIHNTLLSWTDVIPNQS